jgi:hypothetical protein
LSTRENPCLGAGGCRGGFVGGDLFRVSRYVSTGARELVRDIERKMRHCVDARNPFQATFNLSISVLRKLWKSFVRGFHTSGAIRRNQTQSGAIRRNQTHSDAISMPGALCFRVFVFWAGRKGLCFVFLCFGLAQQACVLCFRVLADPPQNTARGQSCHDVCPPRRAGPPRTVTYKMLSAKQRLLSYILYSTCACAFYMCVLADQMSYSSTSSSPSSRTNLNSAFASC